MDYSGINRYTEEKVPTIALLTVLRDTRSLRPCGRPQLLTRDVRMGDRSFWAAFALWDRRDRVKKGLYYLPPCLRCATMTGSWCDGCDQPLCSICDNADAACPGCFPPARTPAEQAVVNRTMATARAYDQVLVNRMQATSSSQQQ